jgi:hypothetical protein
MKTKIRIWSKIGSTPITGRKGAYCDVLLDTIIDCASPDDAKAETVRLIRETPHGENGYFYMPDHPNQNINRAFV